MGERRELTSKLIGTQDPLAQARQALKERRDAEQQADGVVGLPGEHTVQRYRRGEETIFLSQAQYDAGAYQSQGYELDTEPMVNPAYPGGLADLMALREADPGLVIDNEQEPDFEAGRQQVDAQGEAGQEAGAEANQDGEPAPQQA